MGLAPAVAFFARRFLGRTACLLLSLFLSLSAVSANEICEAELLAVNALAGMVKNALSAGELKSDEVANVFANGKWGNPFALEARSIDNIHRRGAFARVSAKFSEQQKDAFRSRLQDVLREVAKVQAQVAKVRETTRFIVLPKVLFKLPAEFENSGVNHFSSGHIDGRPVFVGLMTKQGEHSHYLIDYFRKDSPDKKIRAVGKKRGHSDSFENVGKIFRWNSVDYFADLDTQIFINLNSGDEAGGKFAKLRSPQIQRAKLDLKGWDIVQNSEGAMSVIAAWNSKYPELKGSFLSFANLDGRRYTYDFVANGVAASPIGVNWVDGLAIVSWIPRGEDRVQFYQLGAQLDPLASVQVATGYHNSKRTPLVYSVNDQLLALIPYDDVGKENSFKLGVYDIRKRVYLRDIKIESFQKNSLLDIVRINGRLTAKLVGPQRLTLIDLVTEKVSQHDTPKLRSEPKVFDFNGRSYVLWGTIESRLEIYDIEDWHFVGALDIGAPAIETSIFEIGGEPIAFVPRVRLPPLFVRLVDNGQELRW